ncbi:MAG: AbiV family abortive infection protein [Candidatus Paceibacterota bacterium]
MQEYKKINKHLERYWLLSREFFLSKDYGLAAFFAITLIEEISKLVIIYSEDYRFFKNHDKKYQITIGQTLFANARVSRIYKKKEKVFADWFKENKLFEIRNKGLYLEKGNKEIMTPNENLPEEDVFLLVCFAGEIFAEIQGFYNQEKPEKWSEIIKEVDYFRNNNKPDDFDF